MTLVRRGAGVAALLAGVACGRERAAAHDGAVGSANGTTSGNVAGAAGTAGGGATAGPACPRTGHWSDCQVKLRLEQAGLAPQSGDTLGDLHLPALDAKPTVYTVGPAPLAIYLFADSSARNRAALRLDTARFIPPTRELSMRGEATAIQNDNLLAILISRRDQQRERVSDALSAGPPQP